MIHVSRTHRVALDWLFDRINLYTKIQIRYIDTKHQLADILTKGNFTRDECNNLLHLLNVSHFSLISCSTMAKRIQNQKEEERVVSKSRPAVMNMSSYFIATNKIDVMKDIDAVPSNVQSSRQEALLYVFEDNEAVFKMIIKGRSPTMRHVSRTHRVALDWLLDRINLDPKIQIKCVDTKNQLADMLSNGSFTCDEWEHLLRVLNIMNSSMFPWSHFLSNKKQSTMLKRTQQSTSEKGSAVAKPRPMNLVLRNLLSAKKNPPQRFEWFELPGDSELDQSYVPRPNSIFSRAATRWHSILEHQDIGAEWWFCKFSKHQEAGARWWHSNRKDNIEIPQKASLRPSIHWEGLQEPAAKLESRRDAPVLNLRTNVLIWWSFMSTTMKADIRLGPNYIEILKYTGTQTSRNFRIYSISSRNWHWTIKLRFWMWQRVIGQLPHGALH